MNISKQKVIGLPMTAQRGQGERYLIEDKDGFLISVPDGRLESRQRAQSERAGEPLCRAEQQLRDRIVQMVFGEKK